LTKQGISNEVVRDTIQSMQALQSQRNARTHTLHHPVRWKYAIIGNMDLNGINPPLHAWS